MAKKPFKQIVSSQIPERFHPDSMIHVSPWSLSPGDPVWYADGAQRWNRNGRECTVLRSFNSHPVSDVETFYDIQEQDGTIRTGVPIYVLFVPKPEGYETDQERLDRLHPRITYFILAGDAIKIGSTRDIEKRTKAIQIGSPHLIRSLLEIPASLLAEKTAHRQWKHLHIRGEWFHAAEELLDWIKSYHRKLSRGVNR